MTVSSVFWLTVVRKTRIPEGIERVRNADSTREICCSILWQTSVERSHCFGNNACRRIPFFPRSFFHESCYDELAIKHRISVYIYTRERERERGSSFLNSWFSSLIREWGYNWQLVGKNLHRFINEMEKYKIFFLQIRTTEEEIYRE